MGAFRRHIACPKCGSSDANSEYEDGTTFCFACQTYGKADGDSGGPREHRTRVSKEFKTGSYMDISSRGISEGTCRHYGYQVETDVNGEPQEHIANYRDESRQVVAQKIRGKGKSFSVIGNGKDMPLFGQHLWSGGGKSVVITEGELDALSVAEAFDCKWPVVSLPNGAQSAVKAIQNAYEWLCGFEKIVLWFDNDEHGQKAVEAVAADAKLPIGSLYVIRSETKDANELLLKKGKAAVTKAYWSMAPWRPDGIVSGSELTREALTQGITPGYTTPYPELNKRLGGLRKGELTLLTAGSGIGKSTLAREVGYHLHQVHGLTIGNVFLEESIKKTAQSYVAIHNNVPLGDLRTNPALLSEEQWDTSIREVVQSRQYFYDHFGSLDSERLLAKLRYLAVVLKCDFILLDHISIVVSGQESSSEGERKDIDRLMTKLRSLVEETGVGIVGIVHLRQPDGRPHEEGGRVTLSHLRGSGSLKQLYDSVIALERDQQDQEKANQCQVRILKNREFGEVGEADLLEYSRDTGRLLPIAGGDQPF